MSRPAVEVQTRQPSKVLGGIGLTVTALSAISLGVSDPGSVAQTVSFFATGVGGTYSTYEFAPTIVKGVAELAGVFSDSAKQRVEAFGKSIFAINTEPTRAVAASSAIAPEPTTIAEEKYTNETEIERELDDMQSEKSPLSPTRDPDAVSYLSPRHGSTSATIVPMNGNQLASSQRGMRNVSP